jgi:hypothetical protein
MDVVNLSTFCAAENSSAYAISKPWRFKGWAYATDSRIAVRRLTSQPDSKPGKLAYPTLAGLFSSKFGFAADAKPWPESDGLYYEWSESCDCLCICECNQTYGCKKCHDGIRPQPDCKDCKGSGYIKHIDLVPQLVGGRYVPGNHFQLIACAGSVMYSPDVYDQAKPAELQALSFIINEAVQGIVGFYRPSKALDLIARGKPKD